jgi:hypothetical protein
MSYGLFTEASDYHYISGTCAIAVHLDNTCSNERYTPYTSIPVNWHQYGANPFALNGATKLAANGAT